MKTMGKDKDVSEAGGSKCVIVQGVPCLCRIPAGYARVLVWRERLEADESRKEYQSTSFSGGAINPSTASLVMLAPFNETKFLIVGQ